MAAAVVMRRARFKNVTGRVDLLGPKWSRWRHFRRRRSVFM
jgi:hypothetical protein